MPDGQFQLPDFAPVEKSKNDLSALKLNKSLELISVIGENFNIEIDKATGIISSYEINGMELIKQGPLINFWRASNDNDKGSSMNERLGVWRDVSNSVQLTNIDVQQTESGVAGDNSWGAMPYRKYCVPAQDYEFSFTIEPVF